MVRDYKNNEYHGIKEMCATYGITESVYYRLKNKGKSLEEILSYTPQKLKRRTLRQYCIDMDWPHVITAFEKGGNEPATVDSVYRSTTNEFGFCCPECNNVYKSSVANITRWGSVRCKDCQNRGEDYTKTIQSEFPDTYALMFDSEKNGITPDKVSFRSQLKYHWKCPACKREFDAKVCYVTTRHKRCICQNEKVSDAEKILLYYLPKIDENVVYNYRVCGWRYDFYLPKYNLLIEYDGYPHHNEKSALERDIRKDKIAKENNYNILRIRDERLLNNDSFVSKVWMIKFDYSYTYFSLLPEVLTEILGEEIKLDINVKRDQKLIDNLWISKYRGPSLLDRRPEIIDYLVDDDLNGDPRFVYVKSDKIVFKLHHPQYKELSWSYTAWQLFELKSIVPVPIQMCVDLLDLYPSLYDQIVGYGMSITQHSLFSLPCTSCGREVQKTYTHLRNKRFTGFHEVLCKDCLTQYRVNHNLHKGWNR